VESIQEAVSEQVGKQYRVLGSPKPEYDEDAQVDKLAGAQSPAFSYQSTARVKPAGAAFS